MLFMASLAFLPTCRAEAGGGLETIKSADNYKILAGTLAADKKGAKSRLAIEIRATGKWKFNKKAPVAVNIEGGENLKLDKNKLRNKDVVRMETQTCRFEVPFQAPKKGRYDLKIRFDFVICTDTLCQKKRFDLTYPLSAG